MTLSAREQARRKDITKENVAIEALAVLEEIEARGGSSSEVFTVHGYSLSHVLIPAMAEEKRIIAELAVKDEKEVTSDMLSVAAVKAKADGAKVPEIEIAPGIKV